MKVNVQERRIILSLGSNLGSRENNLNFTIKELLKYFSLVELSAVYESSDIYNRSNPPFLNQLVELTYDQNLEALELLKITQEIELKVGGVRLKNKSPRYIDIDIIFFNNLELDLVNLNLPHKDWFNRSFVVFPLKEFSSFVAYYQAKYPWLDSYEFLNCYKAIKI